MALYATGLDFTKCDESPPAPACHQKSTKRKEGHIDQRCSCSMCLSIRDATASKIDYKKYHPLQCAQDSGAYLL